MGGDELAPRPIAYQLRMQRIHMVQPHEKDHQSTCGQFRIPRRAVCAGGRHRLDESADALQRRLIVGGEQLTYLRVTACGRVYFQGELAQEREGRVR